MEQSATQRTGYVGEGISDTPFIQNKLVAEVVTSIQQASPTNQQRTPSTHRSTFFYSLSSYPSKAQLTCRLQSHSGSYPADDSSRHKPAGPNAPHHYSYIPLWPVVNYALRPHLHRQ